MELFSVVGKLLLDSSGFDKGVSAADKSGQGLASKLEASFNKIKKFAAGALSVAAIKKGIDSVMQLATETSAAGDKIDKQSQALGLSRKAYQEWDYILGQSGASIDSMGISMKTLNGLILDAAAGGKESKNAFAQLGLGIHEIETLNMEDQFESVVRAFQKMPPSAQKSALAVQLFGRNGQQLLPLLNSSATTIDELRERAEQLGIIMSDDAVDASVAYNDAMDDLTRTFNGMKYAIGSQVLPVLTRGVTAITNYAGKIKKAYDAEGFKGVWNTLVEGVKSIKWPTWEQVGNAIKTGWNGIVNGVKGLAKLVFGENVDGSIKWPTWDDVKTKASEAWNTIVEGVKTLGGLAFGTKEDGTVNWPTWKEVGQKANEAWNSIKEEAAKLTGLVFGDESAVGNFTTKLETLKNKWSELKETVSNNAIDFLSGLTGEDPEKVVSVLNGVADAVMSIGVGIGVFQIGTKIAGIVTAVQTLLSSGLSVSHPVLLAISALAAAGTLIYQNWDGISEFFQNLWSGISQWAGEAYKTVEKWWKEDIVKPIKEKWNEIVQVVQGVVADVQSAWNVIVEWFTDTIVKPISNSWDGVLVGVNNAIGAVKTAWAGIVGWFEENVIGPIRGLWEGIAGMFSGSATANQPKGGRGAYSGEYAYYAGDNGDRITGRTALMNAKGSWSIPYDDYLARLHRGEMVLTASQARRYRDGEGMGFDPSALVSSIVSAIQSGMQGVTVNSYLSGRSISDDVNSRTIRQLKARRFAT